MHNHLIIKKEREEKTTSIYKIKFSTNKIYYKSKTVPLFNSHYKPIIYLGNYSNNIKFSPYFAKYKLRSILGFFETTVAGAGTCESHLGHLGFPFDIKTYIKQLGQPAAINPSGESGPSVS